MTKSLGSNTLATEPSTCPRCGGLGIHGDRRPGGAVTFHHDENDRTFCPPTTDQTTTGRDTDRNES